MEKGERGIINALYELYTILERLYHYVGHLQIFLEYICSLASIDLGYTSFFDLTDTSSRTSVRLEMLRDGGKIKRTCESILM